MRFCSLGSGSSGNATLIETINGTVTTRLLIDCGMPYKHLMERLATRGLDGQDIDAVFVTHEHSDHLGCARQLAAHDDLQLWMSRGTFAAMASPELVNDVCFAQDGVPIAIGDLQLAPFTVAHDAKEPLQLAVTNGKKSFGLLTDLGHVTPYVISQMQRLDAVMLEFNHDEEMLHASKYPPFLKQRISGGYGHLSNAQAVECLKAINHKGLRRVVAAHLSEQNNTPELVSQTIGAAMNLCDLQLTIANAEIGFDWIEI